MQRPGRLHITWDGDNALKIETDAGTQTRTLRFGTRAGAQLGEPSWQGYSQAVWQVNGRPLIDTGGTGFVPINRVQGATRGGQLKVDDDQHEAGLSPQERRALQRQGRPDGISSRCSPGSRTTPTSP